MEKRPGNCKTKSKRGTFEMTNDSKSLAHTKWNCKYHIVFAPKYRRKVFFGEKRAEIGKILRQLCEWKGIEIHEAEICTDHVHMLVSIPPKVSVSGFMGYLKGKGVLAPRVLRRYSGKEQAKDCGIYPASIGRG